MRPDRTALPVPTGPFAHAGGPEPTPGGRHPAAHSPHARETDHSHGVSLPLRRPWQNDGIKQ